MQIPRKWFYYRRNDRNQKMSVRKDLRGRRPWTRFHQKRIFQRAVDSRCFFSCWVVGVCESQWQMNPVFRIGPRTTVTPPRDVPPRYSNCEYNIGTLTKNNNKSPTAAAQETSNHDLLIEKRTHTKRKKATNSVNPCQQDGLPTRRASTDRTLELGSLTDKLCVLISHGNVDCTGKDRLENLTSHCIRNGRKGTNVSSP